jgi:hypothetical protein
VVKVHSKPLLHSVKKLYALQKTKSLLLLGGIQNESFFAQSMRYMSYPGF